MSASTSTSAARTTTRLPETAQDLGQAYVFDLGSGEVRYTASFLATLSSFENYDNAASSGGDEGVIGTAEANRIATGGGGNSVAGLAGADQIYAGAGDDLVYGGADNDQLYGGAGNDFIDAGTGEDLVFAGDGDDTVLWTSSTRDEDSYYGGAGGDTIIGPGANTVLVFDLFFQRGTLQRPFLRDLGQLRALRQRRCHQRLRARNRDLRRQPDRDR